MTLKKLLQPGRLYVCTFLASSTLFFLGLCFIPDDSYIRMQLLRGTIFERLIWVYERICFDSTPIDVVILGNSRSGAAINSPRLEELLNSRGMNVRTTNFSIAASGFDIQYSLAERLFSKKTPRILLISLSDQLPRDGHQAFADIAEPIDILRSPIVINRNLARNMVYLPMRQLRSTYGLIFSGAEGYSRDWNQAEYAGSNPDGRKFATGTRRESPVVPPEEDLERDSRAAKAALTKPILPRSLQSIEFGVSEYYLDQIIRLAESKNTKVCFLYFPFYHGFEYPLDREWLESRAVILPAGFLRSDSQNYFDIAHTSYRGSALATEWLAEELTKRLADQGHP